MFHFMCDRTMTVRLLVASLALAFGASAMALDEPAQAGSDLAKGNGRTAALTSRSGQTWASSRFVYKAESKRITEVLQDFAASQGLPAIIAEGVDGVVQANFDTTPDKFLNSMSKAYGVVWYHDGTALYFYPANAVQSRLFRLKGFSRNQVTELLDSLQLGDRRYPLRFNNAESTLLVYGPPRHVELIGSAIESLDVGAAERNHKSVRVVPLRFASAADRTFGQTKIRGVAATMALLYGGKDAAAEDDVGSSGGVGTDKLRSLQGVLGRDSRLTDTLAQNQKQHAASNNPGPKSGVAGAARSLTSPIDDDAPPTFQADEGTNSVMILGRPQRMAEYVEVLTRLDVRPVLVELEATIIDVNSDSLDTLGIDWSVKGARSSFGVTPPDGTAPGAFNVSTLWSNAGRELMARINVLSSKGKARVVAKPKVLGVANRTAVMREKRVATVKVAGNLEANLYQVEAGTLLQVTPQVTPALGSGDVSSRIKLSLYIEDGSFEQNTVDGIPIVKRTEITTEAHVDEGQSLLIGGITTVSDSSQLSEVPGVSKIPLLGALFRRSDQKRAQTERLFLISPRLVRDVIDQAPRLPDTSIPEPAAPPAIVPDNRSPR